jgi:hypothetical protein
MNDRRRSVGTPRDRFGFADLADTPEKLGFIAYGMSRRLPADACAGFRDGYATHRDHVIDVLTAMEARESIDPNIAHVRAPDHLEA